MAVETIETAKLAALIAAAAEVDQLRAEVNQLREAAEGERWRQRHEEQVSATRQLDDMRMAETSKQHREIERLRTALDHIATAAANAADDFARVGAVGQARILRGFADHARQALNEEN
jgi:hypothetical protein